MRKCHVIILIFIAAVFGSVVGPLFWSWTYPYDTATPPDGQAPSLGDDRIREKAAANQERQNVDHYWPLTGTQVSDAAAGQHRQIEFYAPISTPTNAANKGWFYTKDVNSVVEAHWLDESGNELQITSYGNLYSSSGLSVAGNTTLTGNLAVTGTLDVSGNIDPNTFETTNGGFLDEDDMASDSATSVASQQSIKKYVDDQNTNQVSGLVKAWVSFDGDTGTINGTGYNITSVARSSTGIYTVTWDTDFADDDYAVAGYCSDSTIAGFVCAASETPLAAGTAEIRTYSHAGNLTDFNLVTVIAIGY